MENAWVTSWTGQGNYRGLVDLTLPGSTRRKGWHRKNDIRTISCCRDREIWVPKLGKDYSPDSIEAIWETWRNDAPKDECKMQLEGPEKEWWSGTELGLLRTY
jgi:hypothetical protein